MHATLRTERQVSAVVHWLEPNGEARQRELRDGETLVVGSGAEADVRLRHPDVADRHCLLWLAEGALLVRDCYSEAGTFVDGQRISETRACRRGRVQAGTCDLLIMSSDGKPWRGPGEPVELPPPPPAPEPEVYQERDLSRDELEHQLELAQVEIRGLRELVSEQAAISYQTIEDPFQQEMIELLQAEVVQLQAELSRNAHGGDRELIRPAVVASDDELLTREEIDRLANRLEQLLRELDERDEQVGLLQQHLQAAENRLEAERDERERIDTWVNEIESRCADREAEWEVKLKKQAEAVAEARAERAKVEQVLTTNHNDERIDSLNRLLEKQRAELDRMRAALEQSQATEQTLQATILQQQAQARAESVQLSQERAAIARTRHQLETAMREAREAQAVDLSSKQFELKLRELKGHQSKPAEVAEEQPQSLTQRLRSLWQRIEG
ncbi:MAG: FHA domain-containing protein [Planctomycetaceae bacterium]